MEVYFVDVGQGESQLILLGGRRAFVIDCGGRGTTLLHLLKSLGIQQIAGLALSHSHDDHRGAAETILTDYEGLIDRIFLLQDSEFFAGTFWATIESQLNSGSLERSQLMRLEVEGSPKLIIREPKLSLELKLYSPSLSRNLQAQAACAPNETSAVFMLKVGNSRVLFPGDATIAQWRDIFRGSGRAIKCDITTVPHHAGKITDDAGDLDWLYSECLNPAIAIISVGTSNAYGHPRPEVITALQKSGAVVMCTQITSQCCRDLEPLRPGVLRPLRLICKSEASRDATSAGNSRNVACAGTILAIVETNRVTVDRLNEHQAAVDNLAAARKSGVLPLCRR